MSVTEKRQSVSLTKQDLRYLKILCEDYAETPNAIIRRAIEFYYHANCLHDSINSRTNVEQGSSQEPQI